LKDNKLIIFAKNPKLGNAKSRIAKTAGEEKAFEIYLQLLDHTRYVSQRVDAQRVLYYSNEIIIQDDWSLDTFEKNVQVGDHLGDRMLNAFRNELKHSAKAVIIGSDCLQITNNIIKEAFDQLEHHDLVIGPSKDGGYYLIGMNKVYDSIFTEMPWSQATLYEKTLQKLNAEEVNFKELVQLSDIDHEADWTAQKQLTDNLKYIYHVMTKELWESQSSSAYYTADSLQTEGFIHCCFQDQYEHVLGNYFKPNAEVVILKLDRKAIGANLVLEQSSNNDFFPHIYDHITKTWVVEEKHFLNSYNK